MSQSFDSCTSTPRIRNGAITLFGSFLILVVGAGGGAAQSDPPEPDRQEAFERNAEARMAIEDADRRMAVERAVRQVLGAGNATREDLEAEQRARRLRAQSKWGDGGSDLASSGSGQPTVFGSAEKLWLEENLAESADRVLQAFLEQQHITPGDRLATYRSALSIPDEPEGRKKSHGVFSEWKTIGTGMFHDLGAARHSAGRIRQTQYVYDDELGKTTIYAASSGGGLFRLVPLALFAVWQPMSDTLPAEPMVGSFVVDSTNSRRILIATGDWGRRGGSGIWKTTDGGATWAASTIAAGPAQNHYRIRQDRQNPDLVMVVGSREISAPDSTPAGIWRSTDFGGLFVQVYSGIVTDVVQHPINATWWYAAAPGVGVLRSIDGGQSFSLYGTLAGHVGGRISYAIAPTNPSLHYMLAADPSGSMFGIFRSWNSGQTWERIDLGDFISWGLGSSMNAIGVDPDDAGRLFIGMGGMQFSENADAPNASSVCWGYCQCNGVPAGTCSSGTPPPRPPFAHSDFTGFTFVPDAVDPDSQVVLWTTDGGIHAYDWGTNTVDSTINTLGLTAAQQWPDAENTLAAAHHTDPDLLLAGTFDNGIVDIDLGRAQQTRSKAGGDGGMVAFSPDDEKDKTGSFGLGWLRFIEIDNGGVNTVVECSGVAPWGPDGLSENGDPPIAIDRTPTFGDRLYTADTEFLYEKALTPVCDWVQVGTDGAVPSGNNLRSFDQANNPSRIVFYNTARASANLWVMDGVVSTSLTRQDRTPPIQTRTTVGTAAAFADRSGSRPDTVYYTTGFSRPSQAFISDNRGLAGSWEEVTGNLASMLPDANYRELIGNPSKPNQLFLATNVGVFRSDDRGANWYRYMNGLPAVIDAMSMELIHDGVSEPTLFLGSFGRGWWMRKIDGLALETVIFLDGFESGGIGAWNTQ